VNNRNGRRLRLIASRHYYYYYYYFQCGGRGQANPSYGAMQSRGVWVAFRSTVE